MRTRRRDYSLMNQIPLSSEPGKLFIGGLNIVDKPDSMEEQGITHIVSVLEYDHCDWEEYERYQRLWFAVEDHPSHNLLQHFERANAFIDNALASGGTVLVHCAMGISRSATVVCAYLMHKQNVAFLEALRQLQEARPQCYPNSGFGEQLAIYGRMMKVSSSDERQDLYSEWLAKGTDASKLSGHE